MLKSKIEFVFDLAMEYLYYIAIVFLTVEVVRLGDKLLNFLR